MLLAISRISVLYFSMKLHIVQTKKDEPVQHKRYFLNDKSNIDRGNLMSPLLVLQNLAHNSTATLAVVKVTNAYLLSPKLPVLFTEIFVFFTNEFEKTKRRTLIGNYFLFLGLHYSSFATRRRDYRQCK